MQAAGWAILSEKGIDVRTVSPTRRGAIVNWLVTTCGVPVQNHWTDEAIELMWQGASEYESLAKVQEVAITAVGEYLWKT